MEAINDLNNNAALCIHCHTRPLSCHWNCLADTHKSWLSIWFMLHLEAACKDALHLFFSSSILSLRLCYFHHQHVTTELLNVWSFFYLVSHRLSFCLCFIYYCFYSLTHDHNIEEKRFATSSAGLPLRTQIKHSFSLTNAQLISPASHWKAKMFVWKPLIPLLFASLSLSFSATWSFLFKLRWADKQIKSVTSCLHEPDGKSITSAILVSQSSNHTSGPWQREWEWGGHADLTLYSSEQKYFCKLEFKGHECINRHSYVFSCALDFD